MMIDYRGGLGRQSPREWPQIEVYDAETGERILDVFFVDTGAGIVGRYARNASGRFDLRPDGRSVVQIWEQRWATIRTRESSPRADETPTDAPIEFREFL